MPVLDAMKASEVRDEKKRILSEFILKHFEFKTGSPLYGCYSTEVADYILDKFEEIDAK